jgi:hypothetical protein
VASRIQDLRHGDINTPLFSDRATQTHDGQIVGLSGKALNVQLNSKFGIRSHVNSQNLHTWFFSPAIGNWNVCIIVSVFTCVQWSNRCTVVHDAYYISLSNDMFRLLLRPSSLYFHKNTDKIQQTAILCKYNHLVIMNVMKLSNYILLKINILWLSILCHSAVFVGLLHKFGYSCNARMWVTLNFTCVYTSLWRIGVFALGEQQIWLVCRSMFLSAAYGRVDVKQEAIARGLNVFVASWNC